MIKYIGSKRELVAVLLRIVDAFPELRTAADVFSGTARVGHALKSTGRLRVTANDHNRFAHTLATCYVQADRGRWARDAERLIAELNRLPGRAGYFTETFCVRSRFFQPHNGERVDAIRSAIADKGLPPELEAVLLTALMEAADRVDSTCGLQMAYVKRWARRSYNDLALRVPELLDRPAAGACRARALDARELLRADRFDIAYLDPPYNQHCYRSNYHIWETLVRWDHPEVYGVACKRVDCRERKSDFNSKRRHATAFAELVARLDAALPVVSFNSEGFQGRRQMEAQLSALGRVFVVARDFKRYVGAQIGIHNPRGELVGEVSHLRNQEFIYLVATPELERRVPDAVARLERLAAEVSSTSPAEVTRVGPTAKAARAGIRPRTRTVLDALRARALPVADLEAATGLSRYQIRAALGELVGRGEVEVSAAERPKRYRLARAPGA